VDRAPHSPISEQTILITGATDGLGRALAVDLAAQGATLLLHGRDAAKLAAVSDEVGGATTLLADLSDLAQVRDLARQVREATDRLDVLVNNAGIGTAGDTREESADGIELRFAVNYLAGYLLTRELLDLVKASAPARIVFVSSAGQMPIDFDDPMLTRDYNGVRAYCQSKLAQIMLAFDLAAALDGTGVTATALHPATYMPTKMVREAGVSPHSSLKEGADATLRLIADPALDAVTGRYFNGEREAAPDAQASDPEARRRLHELSEQLVGA
jgi:NAD(P)-dependent dehydrogenase (short-subunit alcohol dehydrogenase family)